MSPGLAAPLPQGCSRKPTDPRHTAAAPSCRILRPGGMFPSVVRPFVDSPWGPSAPPGLWAACRAPRGEGQDAQPDGVVPSPPWPPCVRRSPHPATACQGCSSGLADDSGQEAPPEPSPGSDVEAPRTRWPCPPGRGFSHAPRPRATLTAGLGIGGWQAGVPRPDRARLGLPGPLSRVHEEGRERDEVGGGDRALPSADGGSRPCQGASRCVPAPVGPVRCVQTRGPAYGHGVVAARDARGGQGHGAPSEDTRGRWMHPVLSPPSTASRRPRFGSRRLSAACGSPALASGRASPPRLTGDLGSPVARTLLPSSGVAAHHPSLAGPALSPPVGRPRTRRPNGSVPASYQHEDVPSMPSMRFVAHAAACPTGVKDVVARFGKREAAGRIESVSP